MMEQAQQRHLARLKTNRSASSVEEEGGDRGEVIFFRTRGGRMDEEWRR